jgi:hypothetical protein
MIPTGAIARASAVVVAAAPATVSIACMLLDSNEIDDRDDDSNEENTNANQANDPE